MNIIAVLAGNKREFDTAVNMEILKRTKGDFEIKDGEAIIDNERYIYIANTESLRGVNIKRYIIGGKFFDRNDWRAIQEMAESRIRN